MNIVPGGLNVRWLCEIYSVTHLLTGKQRGPLGWPLYLLSSWPSRPCLYDPSWGSWCQSSQTLLEVSGCWPLQKSNKQTSEEILVINILKTIYVFRLVDCLMESDPTQKRKWKRDDFVRVDYDIWSKLTDTDSCLCVFMYFHMHHIDVIYFCCLGTQHYHNLKCLVPFPN